MAKKETDKKRDVKVQDLAPKKDAKGGRFSQSAARSSNISRSATGVNATGVNADNSSLNATNKNLD